MTRINVFGRCSMQPFYNGSGSAASDISKCVSLHHALREFGEFEWNEDLYNLYANYLRCEKISIEQGKNRQIGVVKVNKGGAEFPGKRPPMHLEEIPVSVFKSEALYEDEKDILVHAREFSEYAIFVIGRGGAEGFELRADECRVNREEMELIKAVCQKFDKVILLLNASNPLEMGWTEEFPQIRAVLWIGMPGSIGNCIGGKDHLWNN